MSQLHDLAREVLSVLDGQQAYFKAERGSAEKKELLLTSKRDEVALRRRCGHILKQPGQETLFELEVAG